MFVATVVGSLALAACSPPPQPAAVESKDAATVPATQPEAKSIDALAGLGIIQFGPTSTKVHAEADAQAPARVDVWAKADRNLDGYDAALWLDGKRLDNRAISGSTVTGSIPASMLTTAGTFALEIRIGEDGSKLTSSKVDFIVE